MGCSYLTIVKFIRIFRRVGARPSYLRSARKNVPSRVLRVLTLRWDRTFLLPPDDFKICTVKFRFLIEFFIEIFSYLQTDCGVAKRNRIISGDRASHSEFPWLVKLDYNGKTHCGTTLISPNYIHPNCRTLCRSVCLYDKNKFFLNYLFFGLKKCKYCNKDASL